MEVSRLPDGIDDRLSDHLLDDQPTVSVERLEHVGHRGSSREAPQGFEIHGPIIPVRRRGVRPGL